MNESYEERRKTCGKCVNDGEDDSNISSQLNRLADLVGIIVRR